MLRLKNYLKIAVTASLVMLGVQSLHAQNTDTIAVNASTVKSGVQVSGRVTDDATKKGLSGVRVEVEDFSAALTNEEGDFTLKVPSYEATLMFSGEGFDTRRVPLKGRTTIYEALLDERHESFHEQVTLPLGQKPKTYSTEAVGQYHVNAAWDQPNETIDALLQGRIAGLNGIRRSGTPGAGANLFLRGLTSLYATNKPLIIVDNMIFDANDYGESIIANNYTNPLALIDVKDIDHVTVLKDASSIYGTRGANGAIIITTARAKTEATKIDFAVYSGFNSAPQNLPVMNAADYRTYLSEMLQSRGMSSSQIAALPYMNDNPENVNFARYHYNTNWQDKVFDNSMNKNLFLKVTGGDNIATYGISLGFMKNDGAIRNTDLTRYNMRFNAEFNFTRRFTGLANLSFTYNEQNIKDQGIADKTAPLYLSLVKSPFLGAFDVNAQGIESPNLADRDTLGITNPSVIINNMQAYNRYYRFFGSFGFKYEISKNFTASTLFGITQDKVRENFFVPRLGVANDTAANAIIDSRMGSQVKRLFSVYSDSRIQFSKTINTRHQLASRLGLRYQKNDTEQDLALGFNSATDDLVSVQNGVSQLRQVGGGIGQWNWMNVYFNTEYGLSNKFFLSFNAAMDGSSRFGKSADHGLTINGSKFPVMPSLGAAWLISSEKFMANSKINLLKLRALYSISGNDDIGNYNSRQTYKSQNFLGTQGLVRANIANPALQWETSKKLNGGVDIAFWNERFNLSFDAFYNRTENMLVYEPLATQTGFTSVLTNGGAMQNRGIEVSLNLRVLNTSSLKWDFGINAGAYENEIISVPNRRFITGYAGAAILTATGQPANQFYGYTTNGVYASELEASAAKTYSRSATGELVAFKAGDVRFNNTFDAAGDTLANGAKVAVIDANDRQVIGNSNPTFTGGITNRLIWKHFEMNALLTFSQGNDVYNYVRYRLESMQGVENGLLGVNNRWRGNGHVTSMPKASWGDPMGNSRFSDRWIEDGSYLRLRSLSLQYNFGLKPGAFVKSTTIYAIANNLFTLTKYKGYDPEFSATPSVFSQGIDTGLDPQFRTITLGIKIGL